MLFAVSHTHDVHGRPYSLVKGYGEHNEWLADVEKRRESARKAAMLAGSTATRESCNGSAPSRMSAWEEHKRKEQAEGSTLYGELKDAAQGCSKCCASVF
jgi:hypothetical protein